MLHVRLIKLEWSNIFMSYTKSQEPMRIFLLIQPKHPFPFAYQDIFRLFSDEILALFQ